MNAQTVLKANGAKASDLLESLGDTAGALAKTIEVTAVPLVAIVGDTASAFAKSVEERAVPMAKNLEESVSMLAEAVGTTVEALAEDLEQKSEQAVDDVMATVKSFKFGTREAIIVGAAVGVVAAVWLIRRIDRKAAAERLRAAGTRVGQTAQDLTGRVGGATQGLADRAGALTEKAGAVTGLASERVGQVVQQVRSQTNGTVEGAKLRLSDPTSPAREIEVNQAPKTETPANDFDKETQAAIDDAVQEVERVEQEQREEARELGLSNGMKVVAFDGTDIGRVQEVREDAFVLDRPKGSDLLVPLTELARIEGTVAYLRIDVGQVTKMGWEKLDKS